MAVIVTGVGRTAQALGSEVVQIRGAPSPPPQQTRWISPREKLRCFGLLQGDCFEPHAFVRRETCFWFGLVWFGLIALRILL